MGEDFSVLVVGLGNREVTPDALGPYVADHLNVTRHIVREYGKYAMGMEHANLVSAVVPGVMGQTGMETAEIVKGVVRETHPDLVIAVDALAARNSRRLNRTVQIASTGIHPGSGVGNHRTAMTAESLGVPVVGIGVPTVVDAATLLEDTVLSCGGAVGHAPLCDPSMVVSPKDIDARVGRMARLVGFGLSLGLHSSLTMEDISCLVG